jgi:hypothetical protein
MFMFFIKYFNNKRYLKLVYMRLETKMFCRNQCLEEIDMLGD